jgi:hypothetical protein
MSGARSSPGAVLICVSALLLVAINCVLAIQRTAITSDEIIHIPAGYYAWVKGEYRMNAEHPPLAKMWSAIPLVFFLPRDEGPAEASGNFSARGGKFYTHFWEVNRDAFLRIWFWTRTAMVGFTIALGILLFIATRRWFGPRAAVFAILLYALEPTILGHGKLVHTDIAASFMYLLFFFVADGYRRTPSTWRALLLGVVTGLALLTKFSMIILLPVLAAIFISRLWQARGNPNERTRAEPSDPCKRRAGTHDSGGIWVSQCAAGPGCPVDRIAGRASLPGSAYDPDSLACISHRLPFRNIRCGVPQQRRALFVDSRQV